MFALYLAEEKIAPEVVENMRGWPHSGFSVDQSVFLPAGNRPGIERLVQYMIRYYGWYSNKTRGLRRKAAEQAATANSPLLPGEGQGVRAAPPPVSTPARCSQTWAMLIKRVYEIDPLACPRCGGAMKVIAFIEPPQGALIEKILRHCGLWNPSSPRAPPADWGLSQFSSATRSAAAKMGLSPSAAAASPPEFFDERDEPGEWTYVDIDTFEATF